MGSEAVGPWRNVHIPDDMPISQILRDYVADLCVFDGYQGTGMRADPCDVIALLWGAAFGLEERLADAQRHIDALGANEAYRPRSRRRYDSRSVPARDPASGCASSVPTSTRSTSWSSVSIRKSTRWTSSSTADSMRSVASSPKFSVSSAVDSRTCRLPYVTQGITYGADVVARSVVNRLWCSAESVGWPSVTWTVLILLSAKAVTALLREARSLSRRADTLGGTAAAVDDPTTQQLAAAACTSIEQLVHHLRVLERQLQRREGRRQFVENLNLRRIPDFRLRSRPPGYRRWSSRGGGDRGQERQRPRLGRPVGAPGYGAGSAGLLRERVEQHDFESVHSASQPRWMRRDGRWQ